MVPGAAGLGLSHMGVLHFRHREWVSKFHMSQSFPGIPAFPPLRGPLKAFPSITPTILSPETPLASDTAYRERYKGPLYSEWMKNSSILTCPVLGDMILDMASRRVFAVRDIWRQNSVVT